MSISRNLLAVLVLVLSMVSVAMAEDVRPVNTDEGGARSRVWMRLPISISAARFRGQPLCRRPSWGDISFRNRDQPRSFYRRARTVRPVLWWILRVRRTDGEKVDVDPSQFRFEDGRLLMFFSAGTHSQWKRNRATNLAAGDQVWTRIENVPQSRLPLKD